ncbi:MAG: uroporphyrinogen decarboxylase family protein [Armatimonadia bacterium]
MTSQERVMKALNFELPDRVPMLDGFWPEWVQMWRQQKGLPVDASAEDAYQVDTYIAVGDETPYPTRAEELGREGDFIYSRDGWGQTKRTRQSVAYFYEQLSFAYDDKANLVYGDFDPVDLPERYAGYDAKMEALKQRYCVFAKTGGPFIRTYFMRGEVPFLMDMAADPKLASELVMRTAHHLAAIGVEEITRWGLQDTGIWIFDDMASAQNPMFSPKAAEAILAPAWSYMVDEYRKAGASKVILHSDGNILPVLDILIDCGFDGINPVEYRAGLDAVKLRAKYPKLALLGGLDNIHILRHGTEDEIREHTRYILSIANQGGLALGTHSIGPDISVRNWDVAYETWLEYGKYH